ncbi:peptidoglycan-binding protein [Phormidium tenue FACHB-886]|nr:peptidoglycan-binding protein [Phormidium tenue FACHB-886]
MQRFDKAQIQPDPLLKQGDSGPVVRRLQGMLNATGANLVVDSQFGPATRAAVIKFQQQHGLTADGTVGDQTWAKLFQIVEKRPLRVLFHSYQEHQFDYTKAALEWLQAQISPTTLAEFAKRWRNQ